MILQATTTNKHDLELLLAKVAKQNDVLHIEDVIQVVRMIRQAGRFGNPDTSVESGIFKQVVAYGKRKYFLHPRFYINAAIHRLDGASTRIARGKMDKVVIENWPTMLGQEETITHETVFRFENVDDVTFALEYLRTIKVLMDESWAVAEEPRHYGKDT